ncbi:MAG: hypothetical protein JXB49_33660 [Bacteroidales bacterium]|nr:hypothetical protein [Bacteroidales bacterium]
MNRSNKYLFDLYKEYPAVKFEDSLDNCIKSIFNPSEYRYNEDLSFITLSNYLKIRVYCDFNNSIGIGVNDFIKPDDCIFKKSNNDTIIIIKKGLQKNKEYFILSFTSPAGTD